MEFSFDADTEYMDQSFKRIVYRNRETSRRTFDHCTFIHCSFQESVFGLCKFRECTFQDCDLRLIRVTGSAFRDTTFERSNVTGVNWTEGSWAKTGLLNSINFVDCDLSYSIFIGLTLRKMIVTKCVAKDVDFAEADLTQADFTHTDLAESRFLHTNLTEADFTHARNYWIDAGLNTLKQAKFSLPEAIALLRSMNIVLVE